MIFDTLKNWQRYFKHPAWERCFYYLQSLDASSQPVDFFPLHTRATYARIMQYDTRPIAEGVLEAHNRFIDIQVSLHHAERIDIFPRTGLKPSSGYDLRGDVVFFERPAQAPVSIVNHPGTFVVLFPEDAHMAQLLTGPEVETVTKAVVKLPVDFVRAREGGYLF